MVPEAHSIPYGVISMEDDVSGSRFYASHNFATFPDPPQEHCS